MNLDFKINWKLKVSLVLAVQPTHWNIYHVTYGLYVSRYFSLVVLLAGRLTQGHEWIWKGSLNLPWSAESSARHMMNTI